MKIYLHHKEQNIVQHKHRNGRGGGHGCVCTDTLCYVVLCDVEYLW